MSKDALCQHLLAYSVRTGDFVLKSGRRSSWFIDVKQSACRSDGIVLIADALLEILPLDIDAVGGLTMGADPIAFGTAAIAAVRGRELRSFSVRKTSKDHGVTGRIAGALQPGDRVALTEDASTRGTSALEAAQAVRDFGAVPVLIIPVVDRGGTGRALAAEQGIDFRPLVTAADLGLPFEGA